MPEQINHNEQVEAQITSPQSPKDLATQAKKEEVKAGADDSEKSLEQMTIQEAKDLLSDTKRVEEEVNSLKRTEIKNGPVEQALGLVKNDNQFMKQIIEQYLNVPDHNSRAIVLYLAVGNAQFEDNDLFKKVFNTIQEKDNLVSVKKAAMRQITDVDFIKQYADLTDEQCSIEMLPNGDKPKNWLENYHNSLLRDYSRNRLKELNK